MNNERRDLWRHYAIGINSNLLSAVLIGLGHFVPGIPASLGWIGAVVIWSGLWIVLRFVVREKWSGVKHVGYYFALTAPFFWAITERKRRIIAEKKKQTYEGMVERQDDAEIVDKILTPGSRAEGLKKLIAKMDGMDDRRLAMVLGNIQRNARDIIGSRGDTENQTLFQKVVEKSSARTPDDNVGTYDQLLFLLSQIYGVRGQGFSSQVQRGIVGPLERVLKQIGELHFGRARKIVERIMNDPREDHELARSVMKMAIHLNARKDRAVFQLILDRSMERAFKFQEIFGLEFLYVLDELGENLFWFDRQSLRELLTDAANERIKGILTLHSGAYREMKLSALLQDPRHEVSCQSSIFQALEGEHGRVHIKCTLLRSKSCECLAENLSFGGFLSKKCKRKKGDNLRIMLSLPEAKGTLELQGYVGWLPDDESRKEGCGRNIILKDGEESQVRDLYEYLLQTFAS